MSPSGIALGLAGELLGGVTEHVPLIKSGAGIGPGVLFMSPL